MAAKGSLSYYHILLKPAPTILAHASLSVLLHLDNEIDRDTIAYVPLARMPLGTGSVIKATFCSMDLAI